MSFDDCRFYHQDCPAVTRSKTWDTNLAPWLLRLFWIGRRSTNEVPELIDVPRHPAIRDQFRTLQCVACGTRIHVDL